jgi:hypothetical protein
MQKFLGPNNTFYDIKHKERITSFLDTKIKSIEQDPEKKWITASMTMLSNDILSNLFSSLTYIVVVTNVQ